MAISGFDVRGKLFTQHCLHFKQARKGRHFFLCEQEVRQSVCAAQNGSVAVAIAGQLIVKPVCAGHLIVAAPDLVRFPGQTAFGGRQPDKILGCLYPPTRRIVFSDNVFKGIRRAVFGAVPDEGAVGIPNKIFKVLNFRVGICRPALGWRKHH